MQRFGTLHTIVLLVAGNACHQETNFGFNVVQRPSLNAFPNQDFALPDAIQKVK